MPPRMTTDVAREPLRGVVEHRTGSNPSDTCDEQDAKGIATGHVGRIGHIDPVDGRTANAMATIAIIRRGQGIRRFPVTPPRSCSLLHSCCFLFGSACRLQRLGDFPSGYNAHGVSGRGFDRSTISKPQRALYLCLDDDENPRVLNHPSDDKH